MASQTCTVTRRRQRGQAVVEFALVLPILLILLLGIVDFGFGFKTRITVTNATREGARFGAVGWPAGSFPADCNSSGADDVTVVGRACSTIAGNVTNVTSVTVSFPERNGVSGTQTGDSIVVSMTYRYTFITPLGPMLSTFTGGGLPSFVDLQSTTDMRLE